MELRWAVFMADMLPSAQCPSWGNDVRWCKMSILTSQILEKRLQALLCRDWFYSRNIQKQRDEVTVNSPEDVDFKRIILAVLVVCSEVLQPLALQVTFAVGMRCRAIATQHVAFWHRGTSTMQIFRSLFCKMLQLKTQHSQIEWLSWSWF